MEKFIKAGECALRVNDSGTGERVVVLLHGYLESLDVWNDFAPLLTPHFRVVALDLPGHGISEVRGEAHTMEFLADTVRAALDVLGVGRFLPTGHSMGGYVVAELLRKYPERLTGAVMLHSTPNADSDEKRVQRQREIELVAQGRKELLARTNPAKGFAEENRRRCARQIGELADQVCLTEDEGIVALLKGMMARRDNNGAFRQSSVPQLFIFGRGDEHIAAATAEQLAASHPQACTTWLDHSGHMGFVEEPEACARAIVDFVRKIT
ncbi:MAG: alpha/beta hydrolase [Rikenellaceae bacterium]|jgi:pimeloyl-ACP methyl ester carboxylesterase|nr:alpha/beta hydrolase [Rikenellaceae bacterium]